MKKTALIIVALIAALNAVIAQNFDDALRYSQVFYNGTARFNSMGGAFTALGGDISSLNQNPAGIGVFRTSELSVSPQLYNYRSMSNLNGTNTLDYIYDFNLGQAGVVMNLRNNQSETGLLTLNFGYSYSLTNNFEESVNIDGESNGSSLLDLWAQKLNGIADTLLDDNLDPNAADAYLGWRTWLLDPVYGTNDSYGTVYTNYGSYPANYGKNMNRIITNTGYTGEHAISLGANYSNNLYLGATLGITRLEYESTFDHTEVSDSVLASGFSDFNYTYYYRNWGTGYSLKLGFIYKPVDPLRIGFSFHSPTMYWINEYLNDNIVTHITGNNDQVENEAAWFKYRLRTPFRTTIGVAYQVRKLGVISAEYEFVDYGMAKFSVTGSDEYDYTDKNQAIKNTLKSASNIRLGAEARVKKLYFRGGYSYYGKVYRAGDINENVSYSSISGGAGFREQNIYVDFGYTRMMNPQNYILYAAFNESPTSYNDITRNIFTLSFGYKFGY